MAINKTDIFVYAHWQGIKEPIIIGILSAQQAKGKKVFNFEYDKDWLNSGRKFILDPDIQFYSGPQFPKNINNFGIFLDSMPDTWGRTLLKRRAAQLAFKNNEKPPTLYEIDFLLGVYDPCRMGALRYKLNPKEDFLDNNKFSSTPPWTSIKEVQNASFIYENDIDNKEVNKWLNVLIAPGSSLGGARPKANLIDSDNNLWIAKFPSKNDFIDKASWEFLAYKLAIKSGITMAPCKIQKIQGDHFTFFTKRFDRDQNERIHFASAMTMTGNNEDTIRENTASYLDIAEFICNHGTDIEANLNQLWRRIIFNIAISNTDDHLRNHGFLLNSNGWILSPAFDVNPSIDKNGLALNIDNNNNALDFELAKSVGEYFRLSNSKMNTIVQEVLHTTATWSKIADEIGISKIEQELMRKAFVNQ